VFLQAYQGLDDDRHAIEAIATMTQRLYPELEYVHGGLSSGSSSSSSSSSSGGGGSSSSSADTTSGTSTTSSSSTTTTTAPPPTTTTTTTTKPHILFLSAFFRYHSVGRLLHGVITGLASRGHMRITVAYPQGAMVRRSSSSSTTLPT